MGGYFVRVGSTSSPGPAQTIDQVDDEKLAIEMVRVVEETRPTVWVTLLPIPDLSEPQERFYLVAVQEAQQEYDNRDDELQKHAAEVRAEALRRLGRPTDDDGVPPVADPDRVADTPPTLDRPDMEPEPRRKRGHRVPGFLSRRRSEPLQAQQEHDERQTEAAELEADALRQPDWRPDWRPDADESPLVAEHDHSADAPLTADRPDTTTDAHDTEPVAATTISDIQQHLEPPQAQQEHEDEDEEHDERQTEAAELQADALRLVQPLDLASPPAAEHDHPADAPPIADRPDTPADDTEPVVTATNPDETIAEPEPRRKRAPRVTARARRHSEPPQSRQEQDEQENDDVQTEAAVAKADALHLPDADESPPAAERDHPADVPPTAARPDTTADAHDTEPVATPTSPDDSTVETIADPEPRRKRGHGVPTFRARRRSEPLQDRAAANQVGTESSQSLPSSDAASEINERLALYALTERRQPSFDRRSFVDRRQAQVEGFDRSSERRTGGERRSGRDRRRITQ